MTSIIERFATKSKHVNNTIIYIMTIDIQRFKTAATHFLKK